MINVGANGEPVLDAALRAWRERVDCLLQRWRDPRFAFDEREALKLAPAMIEGIRLRRDVESEEGVETGPRWSELVDRLYELEAEGMRRLEAQPPSQTSEPLAHLLENFLEAEHAYLTEMLARKDLATLTRAELLEGFRGDLSWWKRFAAWLDREPPPDPYSTLSVRLGRLNAFARRATLPLLEEVRRVELDLWREQVRLEMDRSMELEGPVELWRRRFVASSLESQAHNLVRDPQAPDATDETMAPALRALAGYRETLATQAERKLSALSAEAKREAFEDAVLDARGEINENATILEELPPEQAVVLLELAKSDLSVLASTGARLAVDDRTINPKLRLAPLLKQLLRLERLTANELQDKRLTLRMESCFGRRAVELLENAVLAMILCMTALIAGEWVLEATVGLSPRWQAAFAWLDLGICCFFLAELTLKTSLAQDRLRYFRRHLLVDFLPSIPFGFLAYQLTFLETASAGQSPQLVRLVRLMRLPRMARYLQAARPLIRVLRLAVFGLRFTDQLVRRGARVFNRNIILFETERAEAAEPRHRRLLAQLQAVFDRRYEETAGVLSLQERSELARRELLDFSARLKHLAGAARPQWGEEDEHGKHIPVETAVERLIEMTPEGLIDQMGPAFAESIHRYIRLFDAPLVRRLPFVRELVAARRQGPAEAAALAANLAGHLIAGLLHLVYFLADLQATVSAPIFLDRLGTTLVSATGRPAKRLLLFGAVVMVLSLLVWPVPLLRPVMEWIDQRLVRPIILLGLICLLPLILGVWLRRIANQAAEFCERVVEAQFAAQTKRVKRLHRAEDDRFLRDRVVAPEIALRRSDDVTVGTPSTHDSVREEESLFLHSIELLYQDYLDGSMFHRSDTKTTTQLLGNLALANLRLSSLPQSTVYAKRLASLDLSRQGSALFGGPYLWFNYITRGVTQHTARLLVDYNRHAIPQIRLACSPEKDRERFRDWLSRRLRIPRHDVVLPPACAAAQDSPRAPASDNARREEFLETVDFMAVDFLTEDAQRDAAIRAKYGDQTADLLLADRQDNVRRAFRSLPLHRIPLALRTINPYMLYETYLARGRILLMPIRFAVWSVQLVWSGGRRLARLIAETLHPEIAAEPAEDVDSYAVALRKIHRMRKPIFMESLWMRARFDVEYVGLPLPGLPSGIARENVLERDLSFIGAARRDRVLAERMIQDHRVRLHWIGQWLQELNWTGDPLKALLRERFPYLADRSAEVIRALATAWILDHDDVFTLAASMEGLRRFMAHAANPSAELETPPIVAPSAPRWYSRKKRRAALEALLELPCFPRYDLDERARIKRALRRKRAMVRGWAEVLLSQGGDDPWRTLQWRLEDVIRRTDLWSDQLIALRTIQSLTMLDVSRYCQLVWNLGGYEKLEEPDAWNQSNGRRSFPWELMQTG